MPYFVSPDSTRINYESSGRGEPTLLFVHGWCSNLRHWDAQVEHFRDAHRVVAVDRRGHGRSDVAPGGYTVSQNAAELAGVLTGEGVESAVAIGHAGGCPSVLELAVSHPRLVRGLVLVDTHLGTGGGRGLQALIDRIAGPEGDAAFTAIYRSYFAHPDSPVATAAVRDAERIPRHVAVADLAALNIDSVALARQVSQPVLWLTVDPADEARLRAVFDDVRFAEVADSGHFPHLEAPARTTALIQGFVDSLG